MRRLGLAALAGGLLALAGCGTPSKDLFVVERSGEGQGAKLTLLVSDDGSVRCNGDQPKEMGSERLLEARRIERELEPLAHQKRVLEPGERSILRYTFRLEEGSVEFSDSSPRAPREFLEAAGFTRMLAKQVCGLAR